MATCVNAKCPILGGRLKGLKCTGLIYG